MNKKIGSSKRTTTSVTAAPSFNSPIGKAKKQKFQKTINPKPEPQLSVPEDMCRPPILLETGGGTVYTFIGRKDSESRLDINKHLRSTFPQEK